MNTGAPADGYVVGPGQTREKPLGDGPVERLHAASLVTHITYRIRR